MKYQRLRDLCARGGSASTGIPRKRSLNKAQRADVFAKTRGRCHVCAGLLRKAWRVDHVIPHYRKGEATLDNFLPICRECNGLRGGYKPEVLRLILRLGIYAKDQIRHGTPLGEQLATVFYKKLRSNKARRRRQSTP